jgi:peptide/nickel transport system permease protein
MSSTVVPKGDKTPWYIYYQEFIARYRRFQVGWRLFCSHPLGIPGVVVILLFALMVVAQPILMETVWDRRRYDPYIGYDIDYAPHPAAPSPEHLLGTDAYGRDVLSQLFYGARVSFRVGIAAAVVAVLLSTVIGGAAGYFGGLMDTLLMGVSDVFVLMPALVVLLIFGLLVRMDWVLVGLTYGILTGLGGQAIVVKSQTLALKSKPYIEAARVGGGGDGHIIRVHILPGLMPIALVHAVMTVVGAVLTESLLAFFSRTQDYLSWGGMIWVGQGAFRLFTFGGRWNSIMPPAISIMLFCSAFYLVGRALDDVLNPRLRQR